MPRNIEIKARIETVDALIPRVAALADQGPFEIVQDDTFFRGAEGRLKLRVLSPERGELILYRRSHESGPKKSFYVCSQTSEPLALRDCLSLAYGQAGRVQKHRTLFLAGRTRIHLDRVAGLGHFLELEVVLADSEAAETRIREAHELMARLGLKASDLIEGAYVDLLQSRKRGSQPSAPPSEEGAGG